MAEVEGWGHVADIAFYKEEHLAVLAGSGGDMDEAHFVLLPMDAIPHRLAHSGDAGSASAQVALNCLCSACSLQYAWSA